MRFGKGRVGMGSGVRGGDASFVRQRSCVYVFWEGEKVACWGGLDTGGSRIGRVGE